MPSNLHKEKLNEVIEEYKKNGYNIINLKGKIPDAIAVKNNKIIAIEVLGQIYRKDKGWHKNWTYRKKKETYDMFDDLHIITFNNDKKTKRRA